MQASEGLPHRPVPYATPLIGPTGLAKQQQEAQRMHFLRPFMPGQQRGAAAGGGGAKDRAPVHAPVHRVQAQKLPARPHT